MQVELNEAELCHVVASVREALGAPAGGELTEKGRAELERLEVRLGALWSAAFGQNPV